MIRQAFVPALAGRIAMAALATALAVGCTRQPNIDVGKLVCQTDNNCPNGYRCTTPGPGKCVLGGSNIDSDGATGADPSRYEVGVVEAGSADGAGGATGIDGLATTGSVETGGEAPGSGDGAPDVPVIVIDSGSGGNLGGDAGTGGIVSTGGKDTPDTAIGTGGAVGAGGIVGTGGKDTPDAAIGTGGAAGAGGIVGTGGMGVGTGGASTSPAVDCGPLSAPANGTVSAPTTTYNSVATYSCVAGYGPSGSSTRKCQADGTWSGTAPSCVLEDCPALEGPTEGMVSAPSLTYGSIATYSCLSGYNLTGTASRTCQSDRTWTGTAPTCVPVDCGSVQAPAHGSVSAPSTTYLSTATYSCSAGYSLSANATRTCQATGSWSGVAPSCVLVDCGALAAPTNGSVSAPTTTYQSTATYSCATGYSLSGNAIRTCQASGTWDGSMPACGGTPVGHYVVSADGLTVTDTSTGLVWQRDGAGSRPNCSQDPYCTWAEAKTYCAGLTLDGSGWRWPTLTELQSIVDATVASPPTINQTAFPNTQIDLFWTSSPVAGSPSNAWGVYFSDGLAYSNPVSNTCHVRCVR